jgi:hypothetical protein
VVEAVKSTKFIDKLVLGGVGYTYYVVAYDEAGRHSRPSRAITVKQPIPRYDVAASRPSPA